MMFFLYRLASRTNGLNYITKSKAFAIINVRKFAMPYQGAQQFDALVSRVKPKPF